MSTLVTYLQDVTGQLKAPEKVVPVRHLPQWVWDKVTGRLKR